MGYGRRSGALALPGIGLIVGKDVFKKSLNPELLQHEFGHILQADRVGLFNYYSVIGAESLISAGMHGKLGWNHNTFWTETWANYLAREYFQDRYIKATRFPLQNISRFNRLKLFLNNPLYCL